MISRVIRQIPLLILAVIILFPIYFMFANAFKDPIDFSLHPASLPLNPIAGNYPDAVNGANLGQLFWNSAVITIGSVTVCTACATLAAFSLARFRFKGREIIFNLMLPLMVVPPVVMLVPEFRLMVTLGLINSRLSVIIMYIGLMLPFTIYLLRNFFITLPESLLDAARIDGASQMQTLIRVVLPISAPALMTAFIVNFVWAWNELLIALVFLEREDLRTLIVGLTAFQSQFSLNVPVLMAGLTVVTIPVMLLYLFGQRYLVAGLLAGSVKE
jgi:ABC-type glycerol-3-phosphate transport system permease component